MAARRTIRGAAGQQDIVKIARQRVSEAKHELGERGAPWWGDDAPDFNRKKIENSPYASWYAAQATKAPEPITAVNQHLD